MQIKNMRIPGFNQGEPDETEDESGTRPPTPPSPSHTLTRLTGIQDTEDEPPVKERLTTRFLNALLSIKRTQEQIADMQYYSVPRRLPDVFDTGSLTVIIATPTIPPSPETIATAAIPGYDRLQINHLLNRNSPRLTIINDGPGTLYVITSDDGERWSQTEIIVQFGEYRIFNNVFELRLRSPQLTSFRATEGEIYTSYSVVAADLNRADFNTGQTLVPFPGTAVQLPNITIPDGYALVIKALPTNAGRVYIGHTAADAQVPANAYSLGPNEHAELKITNANLAYLDAAVANDGVEILVEV